MVYHVDYSDAETKGCSSKITIEDRIFYAKLFDSPKEPARYYAGDQNGRLLKEISKTEFYLWLRILAGGEIGVKEIEKKISEGKKYAIE
jgi:hypothetical protein